MTHLEGGEKVWCVKLVSAERVRYGRPENSSNEASGTFLLRDCVLNPTKKGKRLYSLLLRVLPFPQANSVMKGNSFRAELRNPSPRCPLLMSILGGEEEKLFPLPVPSLPLLGSLAQPGAASASFSQQKLPNLPQGRTEMGNSREAKRKMRLYMLEGDPEKVKVFTLSPLVTHCLGVWLSPATAVDSSWSWS